MKKKPLKKQRHDIVLKLDTLLTLAVAWAHITKRSRDKWKVWQTPSTY